MKTVSIWISRDSKKGEEPGLLMLHGKKPEPNGGSWRADVSCMAIPDVKHGKCRLIKLEVQNE